MTDQATRAANMRGIFALLSGQALFVGSDSMIKLAGDLMPVGESMAVRGSLAVLLVGAVAAGTIDVNRWSLLTRPLVLVRATLEARLNAA